MSAKPSSIFRVKYRISAVFSTIAEQYSSLDLMLKDMLTKKMGAVYITSNKRGNVLYIGVTSDLRKRIWQHKNKFYPDSFSARYNCDILLWYEMHDTIGEAIKREKQLKGGSRSQKEQLIKKLNPLCVDLWEDIEHW